MDVYRTEEEQVEALKRWWQENGKSIIVGLVLALVAVYGYRAWNDHQQTQGEAASNLYLDLMDAVAVNEETPNEANAATVTHLIGQLKSEYENSTYAVYAALMAAKQAVVKKDMVAAEQELQWAMDNTDANSPIFLIARLRLARVIAAQGGEDNAQRAIELLDSADPGAYLASFEEAKGDIYLTIGRRDEARQAYKKALDSAQGGEAQRPLLSIKIDDLAQEGS